MNEFYRSASILNLYKTQDGYPIERKVINTSGRIGSLYDASTDNLIDRHTAQIFESKLPRERSICRVFSGDSSRDITSFLKDVDCDDAIRQSICLKMVTLRGITRLIEYNKPINENTRFLYYCYRTRKEWLEVTAHKTDRIVAPPLNPTEATHMITKILWGFEILCIIQIPQSDFVNLVDQLLENICDQLKNNRLPITIRSDNQSLISQLKNITIFGTETCIDQSNISLLTVLSKIKNWQKDLNIHQPLLYTMQPLRWLYNGSQFHVPCSFPKPDNPQVARIETIINRINHQLKDLKEIFENFPTNLTSRILDQRCKTYQQKYRSLLDSYDKFQERLRVALVHIRRHRFESEGLDDIIGDQCYEGLRMSEIEKFFKQVKQLSNKFILIEKLKNDQIEYINALDFTPNEEISTPINDIDSILKRTYFHENNSVILWYSSDRLKREEENRYQLIYEELTWEQQHVKQQIKIVYVDFTNIAEKLEDFIFVRLPLVDIPIMVHNPDENTVRLSSTTETHGFSSKQRDIPSSSSFRPSQTQSELQTIPSTKSKLIEINVLLMGEKGVGKSTFINAFVNYLKFENLQQAEQGEPILLIPVSFLITVEDRLDELAVKFNNINSNENHEHFDQSITQQCRSYIFDLNNELRIRFIDTPDITDMRRINQDITAIDSILNYINNLSHLNAICLFFKSNTSELNSFFHYYIKPLLNYLKPNDFNNIIFCYTHTQSISHTLNDTDLLIRKILNNEQFNNISIKKENTFCINNDSFRYLIKRKCGFQFDEYQKQEFVNNWNTSITESIRFLTYIQKCQAYNLENCISPHKARIDILMLARPLMETLRLIIYNWKLSETKLFINHIILNSNPIDIDVCTNCAQINIVELGPFRLTQYQPTILNNNDNQHCCSLINNKNHYLIESNITYEFVPLPAGLKNERWQSSFYNFLFKCDQLIYFLRQQKFLNKDDPFQPILDQYLKEEQDNFQNYKSDSSMNKQICEIFELIKQIRQENSQKLLESNENFFLCDVYQIINGLITIPTVRKQIDSIKTSRQLKMAKQERIIPKDLIKNTNFALFTNSHK